MPPGEREYKGTTHLAIIWGIRLKGGVREVEGTREGPPYIAG